MEVKKLLPLKQLDITIRVDELLKAHKSVEAVLIQNAMKHSKEFMDGMDLITGVESDLNKSKDIIKETRSVFKVLQKRMVISSIDIYKMQRRKKRLEMCRKILAVIYKRFHNYFLKINDLLLRSEYFDALNLIDTALDELKRLPKDAKMDAISQIKKKLMH